VNEVSAAMTAQYAPDWSAKDAAQVIALYAS
jgi:hypothetical protein